MSDIRDGPLEKLLRGGGGGGGVIFEQHEFFSLKDVVHEYFFP